MTAKRYLSRREEAARTGLSLRTLERHCKNAGYPYIRLGNRVVFDPSLSDQYLSDRVHNGRDSKPTHQISA